MQTHNKRRLANRKQGAPPQMCPWNLIHHINFLHLCSWPRGYWANAQRSPTACPTQNRGWKKQSVKNENLLPKSLFLTFKDVILKRKKEEWPVGAEMVRSSPPFPLQPTRDCPLQRAEAWEGESNSKEEERVCARKDKFRSHNFCTHCVRQPYSWRLSSLFWKKKSVYTCVW